MPPQASAGSTSQSAAAGPSTPPLPAHASPAALRHLVLDYLTHAGYKGTALALARDGARGDDDLQALQQGLAARGSEEGARPPPPRSDKDEDEEMDGGAAGESNGNGNGNGKAPAAPDTKGVGELSAAEIEQMGWRSEIRSLILHGDIYASLALLDKHFPSVLDPSFHYYDTPGETSVSPRMAVPAYASSLDPAHLALNLQIQAFIESVRNSSHPGASDDSTPTSSRSGSSSPSSAAGSTPPAERDGGVGKEPAVEDETGGRGEGVYGALHLVQSINARVQRLPEYWRSMYLKELEGVTALLAYGDLKHCPVRKYLDQHRRTALAEQINCAILVSTGRSSQPLLEAAVRQTTFVWARLAEERIAVPASHPLLTNTPARSHWLESTETTSSSQQYAAASEDPRKLRGRILPPWDLHTFLAER